MPMRNQFYASAAAAYRDALSCCLERSPCWGHSVQNVNWAGTLLDCSYSANKCQETLISATEPLAKLIIFCWTHHVACVHVPTCPRTTSLLFADKCFKRKCILQTYLEDVSCVALWYAKPCSACDMLQPVLAVAQLSPGTLGPCTAPLLTCKFWCS
jgi:hypothetical protein